MNWNDKLDKIQEIHNLLVPEEEQPRSYLHGKVPTSTAWPLVLFAGGALSLWVSLVSVTPWWNWAALWLSLAYYVMGGLVMLYGTLPPLLKIFLNAHRDFLLSISEGQRDRKDLIRKLLQYDIDVLEYTLKNFMAAETGFESRTGFLLGSIQPVGMIAWIGGLVALYFQISEKTPKLGDLHIVLLGVLLGAVLVAMPIKDAIDSVRNRRMLLENVLHLKRSASQRT
ncbi:hypothetical protein DC3_57830 [Deinococcus cellulosilyticus NBRC 106333 = KACC 11606]|uniref:Uncharacterized protein n=1 Tax=Deinococcus cellulosilyticus (strain DSM 18568 / NBRC 106333 / KACC 11606 / 5516J-15) TaxID=1223518 RepID=A0A511NCB9_DEIC1|nr:hypothetical protein DC3_57830 [Deinococcus cellulosilyticus NBRC 106333 = KACC 11606]